MGLKEELAKIKAKNSNLEPTGIADDQDAEVFSPDQTALYKMLKSRNKKMTDREIESRLEARDLAQEDLNRQIHEKLNTQTQPQEAPLSREGVLKQLIMEAARKKGQQGLDY